jgi:glycosyltransferase involved in cell wall biosynthesis
MLTAMSARARVILSTYNQLESLRLALRGYLRQTSNDFALTVADDGSREDTREFLSGFASELEARGIAFDHVWHPDDGFRKTTIVNEAVHRSHGEPLLIFSDGDCIPPAHFVARHLSVHEPWSYHVGGAYRLSEAVSRSITPADVDSGRFETLGDATHAKALRRLRRKSSWGTLLRRRNRPKILGLNFAMDRGLYLALNGYDERFTTYAVEDTDLGDRAMRLRPRARVKNLYTVCDVFHLWHPETPGGREQSLALYSRTDHPPRCAVGLDRAERTA